MLVRCPRPATHRWTLVTGVLHDEWSHGVLLPPPRPSSSLVRVHLWGEAPEEAANALSTMIRGPRCADDDGGPRSTPGVAGNSRLEVLRRKSAGLSLSGSAAASRTAVWGASLGENSRHGGSPSRHLRRGLSASPGGGYRPPAVIPSPLPRVYLVAGTLEPFFLENATRWAVALRDAGADVVMTKRVGSHGAAFWSEEFPLMVAWAFGR